MIDAVRRSKENFIKFGQPHIVKEIKQVLNRLDDRQICYVKKDFNA